MRSFFDSAALSTHNKAESRHPQATRSLCAECTDDVLWPATIRDRLLEVPFEITDGLIEIPQAPGWGVELNWPLIQEYTHSDICIDS